MNNPWNLYDAMIAGIPEDVTVKDYALGLHWSCVSATSGAGVSYTLTGGAKRTHLEDWRGRPLRAMAEMAKSWNFEESTLGVAALNAYYAQREQLEGLGYRWEDIYSDEPAREEDAGEAAADGAPEGAGNSAGQDADETFDGNRSDRALYMKGDPRPWKAPDAFEVMRPEIEAMGGSARVVVVGHFPKIERMGEYCDLTILERNCRNEFDTPDPACEFVVPQADFVFYTGVTLINKTAPRLLELAKGAKITMVGPSVTPARALFDQGVNLIATRVCTDPDWCLHSVKSGISFGPSLAMVNLPSK